MRDELIEALLEEVEVDTAAERTSPTTILISSHDLAEIESFATHVGYLHQGKLVFAEEMATLTARFREVTVTLGDGVTSDAVVPASWLLLETAPSVARFVHSQADTEAVAEQIASAFPQAVAVEMEPMTLRTIFLALARSGRGPVDMVALEERRSKRTQKSDKTDRSRA